MNFLDSRTLIWAGHHRPGSRSINGPSCSTRHRSRRLIGAARPRVRERMVDPRTSQLCCSGAADTAAVAGSSNPAALPLGGRVAIVTCASRGIGRAIAAHLSSLGASVVLGYASSTADADALATELPRAVAVRADVSEEAGVRSLFDAAESACRTSWWPTPA
ncbi:hypothetical protein VPH35_011189 [Triticum aestivum]